jgi:hypothetical protein
MATPLRKLATLGLIIGMACVVLCVSSLLEFYENVNKLRAIGYEVAAEGYAKVFLGLLIFLLMGLYSFWNAANLSKADTMLGEIFRKCPLCFGSDTLIWDTQLFRWKEGKVLCRNCDAQWEWAVSRWSSRLTRLSITDYGNALSAEERSLVPDTDSPEHWHGWAKERFRQMRPPSPPPLAPQGQTLFCRFCGHRNLPDAKFCSACGRELSGDSKS